MSKAKEELPEPVCVAMVRDVTKVYRLGGQDVKALAGVSLEFKQGDFVAIMGTRVLSALKSGGRVLDSVLHPISIAALIYLIVYSYLVRKSVMWKGRTV